LLCEEQRLAEELHARISEGMPTKQIGVTFGHQCVVVIAYNQIAAELLKQVGL
jgi:hypothetical protein